MFSLVEVFESVFPNARSEECNNITCHICTRFDTYLHSRMLCRTIKSFLQLNWVCHVFLPSTIHLLVVGSKKFILINTFTSRRLNCINYVDQLPWNIHEIMSVPYQKYLTWHNVENVSWQILHLYKIKTTVNWCKTSVSRQFFKQHKVFKNRVFVYAWVVVSEYTLITISGLAFITRIKMEKLTIYPARSVSGWTGRSIFMPSYFLFIRLGNCKYINDVSAVLVYQN